MRDRLDDVDVGAQALFEDVRGVARRAKADDLERRAVRRQPIAELAQQVAHIRDRVALRERVRLAQQRPVVPDEDRLAAGAPAVEPDHRAHVLPAREAHRLELWEPILLPEERELLRRARERRSGGLGEARLATLRRVGAQPLDARIAPDVRRLVQPKHHRAVRRIELRVRRHDDQLVERHILRIRIAALVPGLRDALAPARLQERQIRVRPAEQQHLVPQRVAARQHGEVLHHDRVGERAHDLFRRDARLDEIHDIRLGEDSALRRDVMQLVGVELEGGELLGGQPDLDHALVDRRARAGGALVVHRRRRGLPGFPAVLEDDDLRVLSA